MGKTFALASSAPPNTNLYWGLEIDDGNVDLYFLGDDGHKTFVTRISPAGVLQRFHDPNHGLEEETFSVDDDDVIVLGDNI